MVQATIKPGKILQLASRFRLLDQYSRAEVDAETKAMAYAIRDEAKTYDAPPVAGYRRTGEMARQTIARRVEGGYEVAMRAPYSGYVRGLTDGSPPAWMHRGRWKPISTIIQDHTKNKARRYREALARARNRAGL